jgi:cell division protein FtsZ
MEILTVAVVTKPFTFEGKVRQRIGEEGLEELKKFVDTLIVIPNDRLLTLGSPQEKLYEMFKRADDVLYYAVKGISDLVLSPGYINLDFADVKAVMTESGGVALMGMGEARGEDRAELAVNMAVSSPLLEDISLAGARGVLLNITVHPETFTLHETQLITSTILKEAHPEAKVFYGIVYDESMEDLLRVTVIGTGIEKVGEKAKGDKIMPIEEGLKRREEKLRRIVDDEPIEDLLDIPTFLRRSAD